MQLHYEKIILGVLVLGFVFSLIYLMQMVDSASEVTVDKLQFRAPGRKYEVQDFSSSKYSADSLLGEKAKFAVRTDTTQHGFTAGLAVPMKSLRCEHKECGRIMPWDIAKKRVCPFCGNEIGDPGEPKNYEAELAMMDSDGDGMPDRFEVKMGFKPDDPQDANEDKDGDGFSNLYEFLCKTDPTDPRSYPPLEKCLYLLRLNKKIMPLMLTNVIPTDKNNKKSWDILMQIDGMLDSKKIGDEITVGERKFKIIDAEYRTKDQQGTSTVSESDASLVTIVPVINNKTDDKNKIVLEVGKEVAENDHVAIIVDVRNSRRQYRMEKNSTIVIKGFDEKRYTFQLLATDAIKEAADLVNVDNDTRFRLEKKMRLPKNAYVKKGSEGNSDPQNKPRRQRGKKRPRVRN